MSALVRIRLREFCIAEPSKMRHERIFMENRPEREPLIILTGPTAVGKTALSIQLARRVGGEIISADSMQVYRHMDIGSAKITRDEMGGVRHHLIDVLEPEEEFHVATFQKMAKEAMREIRSRGAIPIIVGGTGFYIQAVLYDIDFTPNPENPSIRAHLKELARREGPAYLHGMLREVDEEAAAQIHANNVKRVIRALEFSMQTGERISAHNERERRKEAAYRACYFVLNDSRERIYERIDSRVDEMISAGLVDEVKRLAQRGCTRHMVSMQGLGYKEILGFLEGEYDLERAVYLIKRDTRHFAKRQLTWFRRERDVIWVDKGALTSDEACLTFLLDECGKQGILPFVDGIASSACDMQEYIDYE